MDLIVRRLKQLRTALVYFWEDRCLDQAATIAFFWAVSVGPSLYLLCLGLTRILGESTAKGATFTGAAGFFPPAVAATIVQLEDSLELGKTLAVIAIPSLLWTASSAFAALEYAVNQAFATTAARRFWRSRLKAFAGSLLAGALLATSVALAQLVTVLSRYGSEIGLSEPIGQDVVATWARLGLTFGCFTFLFKILPRGRVRIRAAAEAAALSTLCWEAARRLFGYVLAQSPGYGVLTGSLAGLVAFLLWAYTAAAVVLLGAEIAAVLNGNRPLGACPSIPMGRAHGARGRSQGASPIAMWRIGEGERRRKRP